jgi:rod shape determining protein RodA
VGGLGVAAFPVLWSMLDGYQKNRFLILIDPTIDPMGYNERYHTMRSLKSITGGGLLGQGLFNGNRTQTYGVLPAQHTDYIFSAIGEELGYIGCLFTIILLFLIVARVIWVGVRSPDYTRRLICFGAAAALAFQTIINVAMCTGVGPVIGLTLPFISYGATSVVSLYAMLGLVSGVYARPVPTSHELYIRPPM